MSGFECFYDTAGDIYVSGGWVLQPSEGVALQVGNPHKTTPGYPSGMDGMTAALGGYGQVNVGGGGRGIHVVISSPTWTGERPPSFFAPELGTPWYRAGKYRITGESGGYWQLVDEVDVIASVTDTVVANVYDSVTYGEDTYTGGTPFTMTVTEVAGSGTVPSLRAFVTAGAAMASLIVPGDDLLFTGFAAEADADWTLVVNSDGTADLLYLTDIIASRAASLDVDGSGRYEATALGKATYNLTDDEPVDGEDFTVVFQSLGRLPDPGYVYVLVTKTAGVVVAAQAPAFGTILPAPSGDNFSVPLVYCDGDVVMEIHSGAIIL